jgi:hypothetical protein
VILGAAAARTQRIRLTSAVTVLSAEDRCGVHMLGYVAQTTQEAPDTFFPGYAKAMTDVGKQRGWPAMTRASFDPQRGPDARC